jgi:hypothetical protein
MDAGFRKKIMLGSNILDLDPIRLDRVMASHRNSLIPQSLYRMPIDAVGRAPYGPPPLSAFPYSGHRRSAMIIRA